MYCNVRTTGTLVHVMKKDNYVIHDSIIQFFIVLFNTTKQFWTQEINQYQSNKHITLYMLTNIIMYVVKLMFSYYMYLLIFIASTF